MSLDLLPAFAGNLRIPSVGQTIFIDNRSPSGIHFVWTCPDNVFLVSIVCVGRGANQQDIPPNQQYNTVGAGGLGWSNDIIVTPKANYSFYIDDDSTRGLGVIAYSGLFHTNLALTGTFVAQGGGNGGRLPGAGAGGYTGNGGNGNIVNGNGQGGGGGGGGPVVTYSDGGQSGSGGGGVGLYGIGASGVGGTYLVGGKGGSGGGDGTPSGNGIGASNQGGDAGNYGGSPGPGNGPSDTNLPAKSGLRGLGAIRIIWGPGRSFPNNAADKAPVA